MRQRKSFTLIELLVVVAIIAVLVAILLPALVRARNLANVTVCQSNLRQIGLYLGMYTDTYQDYYPPIFHYKPWGTAWDYPLFCLFLKYPTTPSPGIVRCPADSIPRVHPDSKQSYSFQWRMLKVLDTPDYVGDNWEKSIRTADITDGLSNTIILVENPAHYHEFTNNSDAFRWINWYPPTDTRLPNVHNPGHNVLYGDGHTRYFSDVTHGPQWREFTPHGDD